MEYPINIQVFPLYRAVMEPLAIFTLAYASYLSAELFHFSGIIRWETRTYVCMCTCLCVCACERVGVRMCEFRERPNYPDCFLMDISKCHSCVSVRSAVAWFRHSTPSTTFLTSRIPQSYTSAKWWGMVPPTSLRIVHIACHGIRHWRNVLDLH